MGKDFIDSWQIDTFVHASQCDSLSHLRAKAILELMQDVAEIHCYQMGLDGPSITAADGVYWILSKTKFTVNRTMHQGEPMSVKTWPVPPTEVRCHRCFTFKDKNGDITIEGLGEWVLIDSKTRALRKISSTGYPLDKPHILNMVTDGVFARVRDNFTDSEFVYKRTITSSYIDWPHHNNNTNYSTLVLDTFSVEELEKMDIRSMEFHFQHETVENETVSIYRRQTDSGYMFCVRRESGDCAAIVLLDC